MRKIVFYCDDRIAFIMLNTVAMEKISKTETAATVSQASIDFTKVPPGEYEYDYEVHGIVGRGGVVEFSVHPKDDETEVENDERLDEAFL